MTKINNVDDFIPTAIKFAEWLSDNEWIKRAHTHPRNVGKYWSDKHFSYKTIEQLYDDFISEEKLYIATQAKCIEK